MEHDEWSLSSHGEIIDRSNPDDFGRMMLAIALSTIRITSDSRTVLERIWGPRRIRSIQMKRIVDDIRCLSSVLREENDGIIVEYQWIHSLDDTKRNWDHHQGKWCHNYQTAAASQVSKRNRWPMWSLWRNRDDTTSLGTMHMMPSGDRKENNDGSGNETTQKGRKDTEGSC